MDYKIKDLYEEMELELIASMKRNLKRHLGEEKKVGFKFTQWQAEKLKELKRYQRENQKIIGRRTKGLSKKVSNHLQKELKKGAIDSIKQYNKLHKNKLKVNKLLNKSFFQTNDRKVNILIKVVNNDLDIVNASALRMTNDQYRQVIHKSAFFNANGIMTEKQAVDMANKDFLSRGLNCIEYKDGRRINIASYSQMAVRTASLRAHLMGEGDFRKEIGNPLVIVTTHGGACKLCTAWQGKVLIDDVYSGGTQADGNYTLLSEAMKQGFLHPNCRHGLATYYPELEGIKYDEEETDEEIDDALRDKLNYYDRQEQANIRKSKGFIDSVNVKDAKKEIMACEKKKDELIIEYKMPYEDITEELLKKSTPNNNDIPELFKYKNYNLNNAEFDTKDITDVERLTLKKIQNEIGGQFNILHRVQKKGVRTPDAEYYNKILHTNKRYYDVKAPDKSDSIKSKNNKITHQFDQAKGQTKNVIISLLRDGCDLTNAEAVHQIISALNRVEYSWIDRVIFVGKNDYFKIYKKK